MPLILYSTVSSLAYEINERFYGGIHYVWCAPARATDVFMTPNPPSSDPVALYHRYLEDVQAGDRHSDLITRNRNGIIRGASSREAQGVIKKAQRELIEQMALDASVRHFKPLLMIIPCTPVEHLVKPVAISDRAGTTSQEFIIEDLPPRHFDIMDIGKQHA